jgi:hypothetical protein
MRCKKFGCFVGPYQLRAHATCNDGKQAKFNIRVAGSMVLERFGNTIRRVGDDVVTNRQA